MVMQIPAGMIAEKFGGKYVFGIGLLINSILTLLSPVAARSSASALIAVRSLTGFAQVGYNIIHSQRVHILLAVTIDHPLLFRE